MSSSPGRLERTERLLNLVFCLMAARRAVSRAAIQAAVPGYGTEQGEAAFERMFERDKDELRGMGIPVETVFDVNGDVEGYRIALEQYELPAIAFTPREMAVVALAASVWDEAILGPSAVTALRKIEAATGTHPTSTSEHRMSVHVTASDAALMPMLEAVRERRMVTFPYLAASADAPVKRRVDPWGVVSRNGRWYVVGFDHDRQAPRVFRLSRVTGAVNVSASAQTVERSPDIDVQSMVGNIDGDTVTRATVHVKAGEGAALRRLAAAPVEPLSECTFEVTSDSHMQLVGAILGSGASAHVLEPASVRESVVSGLERIIAAHASER